MNINNTGFTIIMPEVILPDCVKFSSSYLHYINSS